MRHFFLTPVFTVLIATLIYAVPQADAAMTRASAEQLMRSGKSLKCSVSSTENGGAQEGSIYISAGKMRGDFEVSDPNGETSDAHMLQDGEWVYTWGGPDGGTQGTKMHVDASAGAGASDRFDTAEEVNMDCMEWQPDAARFEVPAGVGFMDMTGMMAGPGQMPGDFAARQGQACDQAADGPDRDMCRQMMGCA